LAAFGRERSDHPQRLYIIWQNGKIDVRDGEPT